MNCYLEDDMMTITNESCSIKFHFILSDKTNFFINGDR